MVFRKKRALLKGLRPQSGAQNQYGHREIKMLRPICGICAPSDMNAAPRWWETCNHEAYVGQRAETLTIPVYEDSLDDAGQPTGERIITGENSTTTARPFPNLVAVSRTPRLDSGLGVEKGRRRGFILPEELECAAYPNGIEPFCQYAQCFSQELSKFRNGDYCSEDHAARAYDDEVGKPAEVYDRPRRMEQLAGRGKEVRI
jgi:hypothetical protein